MNTMVSSVHICQADSYKKLDSLHNYFHVNEHFKSL